MLWTMDYLGISTVLSWIIGRALILLTHSHGYRLFRYCVKAYRRHWYCSTECVHWRSGQICALGLSVTRAEVLRLFVRIYHLRFITLWFTVSVNENQGRINRQLAKGNDFQRRCNQVGCDKAMCDATWSWSWLNVDGTVRQFPVEEVAISHLQSTRSDLVRRRV